MTDMAKIALLYKMYWLCIGIFTFDLATLKGKGQGHAHIGCEYLVNGDNREILQYP